MLDDLNMDQLMEQFGGFDFSPEQVDAIANMVLMTSTMAKIKELELLGQKYGVDEMEIGLRKDQLIFEQSEKLPFERDKMEFQRQMQELQMQHETQRNQQQLAIGDQNLEMGAQNLEQAKFGTLNQRMSYDNNLMGGAFSREGAAASMGSNARFRAGTGRARISTPLGF